MTTASSQAKGASKEQRAVESKTATDNIGDDSPEARTNAQPSEER